MRLTTFIAAATIAPLCWAQSSQLMQLDLKQTPAKKLFLVGEDGTTKRAPTQTQLRLHTEMLSQPEKVGEVLRRNGLSEDPKTVGMLKRLNPGQDFNAGEIAAGTKLDIFVPKTTTAPGSMINVPYAPMTFDTPVVAKWAVREEVIHAAQVKKVAYTLPSEAFEDRASLFAHRKVVSDIDGAAKVVEAKANTLSAADLAAAKYQIQFASLRADAVNQSVVATGKISSEAVLLLSKAASPTQEMVQRLASGQTPFALRRIKVSVLKGDSQENVKGLQVYVLPAGILDYPAGFTEEDVQTYLTRFSFVDETSPSVGNIAVFDTRVWVGPKMQFREMARLVRSKGLSKYRPIDDPTLASPTVELIFRSPADVVQP